MSPYQRATISARTPWADSQFAAEKEYDNPAPTRVEWFTCLGEHRHKFSLTFFIGADPTYGWTCPKCGKDALADDAPEGAEPGMVESKHGSGLGGVLKGCGSGKYGDVTPYGQLLKRRTEKEGAALLAERMAELAAMRGEPA